MTTKDKKKKKELDILKKAEFQINKHLYLICGGLTFLVMAMILTDFLTRGYFSISEISVFYLGVLVIYSLHKELIRWLGKYEVERQGEYFVYAWIALTTILYFVNFFSKNYFAFTAAGTQNTVLNETAILTLEILAIFIITRGLKVLKIHFFEPTSK